ncbi:MAG TPA: hypothetical protein PK771_14870, partial [Spirochaetota bacterium]|nr:hypothetical protein [Spirochaetota bacterium]
MKNIFIPFRNFTSVGGPSTFMLNLKNHLDKNNFTYDLDYQEGDNIFFPVSYDLNTLKGIKMNNSKIIQRLDGIYYPSKHGENHIELNKDIKDIYLNYADFIIFQSEYSIKQCFEMLGVKKKNEYTIIINGADNAIFYPDSKKEKNEITRFITTGNFRNIDMIEPIIEALDHLNRNDFKFELHIVGPFVNDSLKHFLE